MQMHILASAFAAHTQNIGVNEDSDENFDLCPLSICVSRTFKFMRYDDGDGCQRTWLISLYAICYGKP